MNDIYKFRAWNGQKMYYTDSQTLLQFKEGRWVMLTTDGSDAFYLAEEGKKGNVLMQYTGLKDKNGTEIYEGDILGWNYFVLSTPTHGKSIVKWDENDAKFDFGYYGRPDFCERQIIGNIYENPELLEYPIDPKDLDIEFESNAKQYFNN